MVLPFSIQVYYFWMDHHHHYRHHIKRVTIQDSISHDGEYSQDVAGDGDGDEDDYSDTVRGSNGLSNRQQWPVSFSWYGMEWMVVLHEINIISPPWI